MHKITYENAKGQRITVYGIKTRNLKSTVQFYKNREYTIINVARTDSDEYADSLERSEQHEFDAVQKRRNQRAGMSH